MIYLCILWILTENIGKCVIPSRIWGTPLWRAANVGPKWLSHYFKSEKQTNTILMASFFGKNVESWMGMMVLGSNSCGLWANMHPCETNMQESVVGDMLETFAADYRTWVSFHHTYKAVYECEDSYVISKTVGTLTKVIRLSRQFFANHFCLFKMIVYFVPW